MRPEIVARQVLDTFWDGKLPVDAEAIARRSGIEVRYRPPEVDAASGYDISGRIDMDENGGVIITVSSLDPPQRQRFIIAHEMGHHFMGHGLSSHGDTFAPAQDAKTRRMDQEADEFAAALLMPLSVLDLVLSRMERPSVEKVAEAFGVTPRFVQVRLRKVL